MTKLTHFNASGHVHMVDVGDKKITKRIAITEGRIQMKEATLDLILEGKHKKGDVLGIARIAGIMAAKKTAELIPLCHPLPLTHINIELSKDKLTTGIHCLVQVETEGKTGVEIEALCATQITLLTIYDMCKSVDRGMSITEIHLLEKKGGKSGHWIAKT